MTRRYPIMETQDFLQLSTICPVRADNAGLFISRGRGTHPTRVIASHDLIFVKQGDLDLREDDQHFIIQAGQTLHLWPGRRHGGAQLMMPDLRFYWIHFDVLDGKGGEASMIAVPQVNQICQPEKLENLFRYFLDEQ